MFPEIFGGAKIFLWAIKEYATYFGQGFASGGGAGERQAGSFGVRCRDAIFHDVEVISHLDTSRWHCNK
jgi:hypothetical protein